MQGTGSGLSFGFAKTSKRQKLETSAGAAKLLGSDDKKAQSKDEDETELITAVDGRGITGKLVKDVASQRVIPLLPSRNRFEFLSAGKGQGTETDRAREALIRDAQQLADGVTDEASSSTPISVASVERLNDSIADQVDDVDYDAIPIEDYGMAMLRGMGWKDNRGPSGSKITEPKLRPKGLGLGADTSAVDAKNDTAGDEDKLCLKVGSFVRLKSGRHKGDYGKVESFDADNARVLVKLATSSSIVTESQYLVDVVDQREYARESKCINRDKYEKYKKQQLAKSGTVNDGGGLREQSVNPIKDAVSSKRDNSIDVSPAGRNHPSEKSARLVTKRRWIRRDLVARIIDREFCGGKYYKEKVIIDDVSDQDNCMCRTESGKSIEVKQDMLDPVVPKEPQSSTIMFVFGKHTGELGRLSSINKKKREVLAQLLSEPDLFVTASFDDVCQFSGNAAEYECD